MLAVTATAILGIVVSLTASMAGAASLPASAAAGHADAATAQRVSRNTQAQGAADKVGPMAMAKLPSRFAGIAITAHGDLQVSVVGHVPAKLAKSMRRAAGPVPVTYRFVKHGQRKLEHLTERIARDLSWWARRGVNLSTWGPDYNSDKVSVTLTRYTRAAAAAVTKHYGSSLVTVRTTSAASGTFAGRTDDFPPWFGGDVLTWTVNGATVNCTSGFNVQDSNGADFVLTAGHCFFTGAHVDIGKRFVGVVNDRSFSRVMDAELIPGLSAPDIWSGGRSTDTFHPVTAVAKVDPIGGLICTDGAVTGEVCDVRITAVDQCFHEPFTVFTDCGLTEATKTGTKICQPGDSGGPVETTLPPTKNTEARGEIVAAANKDSTCFYEPIGAVTAFFHVHVLRSG